jgi:Glycosyltransferase 61
LIRENEIIVKSLDHPQTVSSDSCNYIIHWADKPRYTVDGDVDCEWSSNDDDDDDEEQMNRIVHVNPLSDSLYILGRFSCSSPGHSVIDTIFSDWTVLYLHGAFKDMPRSHEAQQWRAPFRVVSIREVNCNSDPLLAWYTLAFGAPLEAVAHTDGWSACTRHLIAGYTSFMSNSMDLRADGDMWAYRTEFMPEMRHLLLAFRRHMYWRLGYDHPPPTYAEMIDGSGTMRNAGPVESCNNNNNNNLILWLHRGPDGRHVANEEEVIWELRERRDICVRLIDIVKDVEGGGLTEQVKIVQQAKMLIHAEGGALVNMLWLPLGSVILRVQSESDVNRPWGNVVHWFDLHAMSLGHLFVNYQIKDNHADPVQMADYVETLLHSTQRAATYTVT